MCPERMSLPRGIVALRAVPPPGSASAGQAQADQRCVPVPPHELKEIQRRAFERGRACERAAFADKLAALLGNLADTAAKLDAAREEDRRHLARFGVEVAMAVAEQVVGKTIAKEAHDVRALVEAILEEALPGLGTGAIQVAVNPDDLASLGDFAGAGAPAAVAGRIRLVPEAGLARAACRIRSGGAEILADPVLRLAAIAEKMRVMAGSDSGDA